MSPGPAPSGLARPMQPGRPGATGPPFQGYLQAPVRQPRNTGLTIAIIVAIVLVAVCIGAAIAVIQGAQQANNGGLGQALRGPALVHMGQQA
jgi:hypothetical protein